MARLSARFLPALVLAALAAAASAQTALPPDAAASAPAARTPEPAVQRQVSEDDNVRIEELKVRGQTQSITVRSKLPGVKPYEIVPSSGARDPSQPGDPSGQRVWHMLTF
ncbi:hypothetical protein [Rubrivivax gelatinosus]|uniref:hypothetical protein n=1 Tax=Rubrivivax gelatinosus TaxID=28068 RepID=UPI001F5B8AE7|nr:hypothetical protein [Rubrivivax gelatinosus]